MVFRSCGMMAAIEFDKLEKCQDKPYLSSFVYHWKVKEVEKSIYKSAFVASPPFSDPCRNTWWHLRLYRPRRKFKRTGKYLSLQLHLDSALPVLAKFTVVANLGSGKKCCRAFFRVSLHLLLLLFGTTDFLRVNCMRETDFWANYTLNND